MSNFFRQNKINLNQLDITVVHYTQIRPTVAMVNAFFKYYPEAEITLVDNSGGSCIASEMILPHILEHKDRIKLLINPATEHGTRGPLSHGAGLDLAFKHSDRPYLLSLETDMFFMERGAIEYALSLMDQGYDWAGIAQKPVDGTFASFSPSFAIFKVALIRELGLSFQVRQLHQGLIDQDDLLIRHHRQTAARVYKKLPLLYPEGKAPDTYRRQTSDIQNAELGHLTYFDTGEWVHHELTRNGYRGYLFITPPGICHTWGSRDENIFFLNIRERLPQLNLNELLPDKLKIKKHDGPMPTACLVLINPTENKPAEHWVLPAPDGNATLNAKGATLQININIPDDDKLYLYMGMGGANNPSKEITEKITPSVFYRLDISTHTSESAKAELWFIEYGKGQRIQHHTVNLSNGDDHLEFLTSNESDQFRILFRLTGSGLIDIEKLALSAVDFDAPKKLEVNTKRYSPKKNACIVICADALRADFADLASSYQAEDGIAALQQLKSMSVCPGAAYTAAPWTLPSHMSMFTGLYPHQHGYGVDFKVGKTYPPPKHLAYLPHYLVGQGIPSYGFHNGGVMEPNRGLGHGWTNYVGAHPGDVDGPVHNFIKALPDMGDTFFAFIHTYAVHNYYGESATSLSLDLISPMQRAYIDKLTKRWGNLRWLMAENLRNNQLADPQTLDVVRRLYLGAVLRFDRLLQQLIDALKTTGSFDNCTIILTSDHGEALGEVHSGTQHWSHMTVNIHEETVRVPFFVKPGNSFEPKLADTLSLVDLPNIVTSCFDLPTAFPERKNSDIFATGATNQFGAEWERTMPLDQRIFRSMLIHENKKHHLLGDSFYPEKVCDIVKDPAENSYIFDGKNSDELNDLVKPYVQPIANESNAVDSVDDDLLERMRGLGYVE